MTRRPRVATFSRPLRLETLEHRNGPSDLWSAAAAYAAPDTAPTPAGVTTADRPIDPADQWPGVYVGPPAMQEYAEPPAGNQPPVITNFTYTAMAGVYTFTGRVNDEQPGGRTVTFGGTFAALRGQTVTTDPSGNFTITVYLGINAGGKATATTVDPQGQTSATAYATVL